MFPDPLPEKANDLARMYMRWCFPEMGIPCPLGRGDTDRERGYTFAMALFMYLADVGLARGVSSAEGTEIFSTAFLLPAFEVEATVVRRAAEEAGIDMGVNEETLSDTSSGCKLSSTSAPAPPETPVQPLAVVPAVAPTSTEVYRGSSSLKRTSSKNLDLAVRTNNFLNSHEI